MAKESVIGAITHEDVTVTAMHPDQRCTVASVAGHAMYERSNAYYEYFAGGTLDMTHCRYEQVDAKRGPDAARSPRSNDGAAVLDRERERRPAHLTTEAAASTRSLLTSR